MTTDDPRATEPVSADRVRELLLRNGLGSCRFRVAAGSVLGIASTEATALALLSLGRELTPTELSWELELSSGGVTALIQRLEARGYLARRPHPGDARSTILSPTASALGDLAALYEPLVAQLDELIRDLGEHERAVIARFLDEAGRRVTRATEELQAAQRLSRRGGVVIPEPGLWA